MKLRLTTSTRRALRGLLCLAAVPMLMGSECEQPLVKDSSFDLWCGNTLCDWQVDDGTVAKVPTWHERDYGVELVGFTAAISQMLPYTSTDVSCIHFDLLADVEDTANVLLTLDFDGGTVQSSETIASGAWRPLSYHLVLPSYFQSLRIAISKYGYGRARLAQIQASKASDCQGPPPVGPLARPPGATCETNSQCAAGRCWLRENDATLLATDPPGHVCTDCYVTGCDAGQVCGLTWSSAFPVPYQSCIPQPVPPLALGSRCVANGECATGNCCYGVCSTCCYPGGPTACPDGTFCGTRINVDGGGPFRRVYQCSPQERHGAAGTPCLFDDDCASDTCAGDGVLQVCADGRRCTSDADCPTRATGNSCTAIGVAGGKCQ